MYLFRFLIAISLMGLAGVAASKGEDAAFWNLLTGGLILIALSYPPKGPNAQ